MLIERQRFYTFTHKWSYEEAKSFAQTGLFRVEDQLVQCAFCFNTMKCENYRNLWWRLPMYNHKSRFPRCPFVCGVPKLGNVVPKYKSLSEVPDFYELIIGDDHPILNYVEY